MQKLNDYFFVDDYSFIQIPHFVRHEKLENTLVNVFTWEKIFVRGKTEEGEEITTGKLEKIALVGDSYIVYTKEQEYELEEMHPDFIELERAIEDGTQVIALISNFAWLDEQRQFYLEGMTNKDQKVRGKITYQSGNYIVLDTKKYFVLWPNWSKEVIESYGISIPANDFFSTMDVAWNRPSIPKIDFPEI